MTTMSASSDSYVQLPRRVVDQMTEMCRLFLITAAQLVLPTANQVSPNSAGPSTCTTKSLACSLINLHLYNGSVLKRDGVSTCIVKID